jgi:uncharacterized protein
MTGIEQLRFFNLILTADCNLRCGYCYQNAKKPLRMRWETLRAALDLARASARREVGVYFLGGEPLLEFPMIRRAVEYLEKNRPPARRFTYGISTNGTLLTDEICAFLVDRGFETQISFDGVPEAQKSRGQETFAVLDRLLDRLREEHPSFYRRSVRVAVTTSPETMPHLADSIDYLLSKGAREIVVMPSILADSPWELGRIEELDAQFERIFRASLRLWRERGETPLSVFRNKHDEPPAEETEDSMCGLVRGETVAIDVDGQAYGCTVHASSYQEIRSPFLRSCLASMRMGSIVEDGFAARLDAFPEAARAAGLFHNKRRKRSAYGRCAECAYLQQCAVCPTSIGHLPGNADPDRVPDFYCAYNLVSLKYRALFPSRPRPRDLLMGPPGLAEEMERWRILADAAR